MEENSLLHLLDLRNGAEVQYQKAILSKDSLSIADSMDRLNKIESEILTQEHRERAWKIGNSIRVNRRSQENRDAEEKRREWIRLLGL